MQLGELVKAVSLMRPPVQDLLLTRGGLAGLRAQLQYIAERLSSLCAPFFFIKLRACVLWFSALLGLGYANLPIVWDSAAVELRVTWMFAGVLASGSSSGSCTLCV